MSFTSFTYLYFLAIVVALYWIVRHRTAQNILLLIASYVFYGWLTPWYCILLASSTVVTYLCLHWLWNRKEEKELIAVTVCVLWNIGLLVVMKYWNFWIPEIMESAKAFDWKLTKDSLQIMMPIALSFYTLQAVGVVIDAYRGDVPRQSFMNVALFLAFFPKLIAGPFEKAVDFLSELNQQKTLNFNRFGEAFLLLLFGFFKKLVVAENVATYVDQIFVLTKPSFTLLLVGGIGFMIQILADFSGYTDIARGSAKLLGFNLMENFAKPYLAVSPSDFWGRWHISLSKWFRDYVYIPLGGSRSHATMEVCWALIITMCLSGMWHGASLNFFLWGLYYGILMSVYYVIGLGGHWKPKTNIGTGIAMVIMLAWTLIGWIIFRCNDLVWLFKIFIKPDFGLSTAHIVIACVFLGMYATYVLPWIVASITERLSSKRITIKAVVRALLLVAILIFGESSAQDFIYVNF